MSNEELARNFYTMELLLERDDLQKWKKYASKQRFGVLQAVPGALRFITMNSRAMG